MTDWDGTGLVDGDLVGWAASQSKFVPYGLTPAATPTPDDIPAVPGSIDYEFNGAGTSLPSGWSWLNQGGAAYVEAAGFGVISLAVDLTLNIRAILRAVPAASTWQVTARLAWAATGTLRGFGLLLRESASSKFVRFGRSDDAQLRIEKWTSNTSGGTSIAINNSLGNGGDIPRYFRITKNSATSWDFHWSPDGVAWSPMALGLDISTAFTSAPDTIGFGFYSSSAGSSVAGGASLGCAWFRQTA